MPLETKYLIIYCGNEDVHVPEKYETSYNSAASEKNVTRLRTKNVTKLTEFTCNVIQKPLLLMCKSSCDIIVFRLVLIFANPSLCVYQAAARLSKLSSISFDLRLSVNIAS